MSGSSRHGSARPSAAGSGPGASSRQVAAAGGTGARPGSARTNGVRNGASNGGDLRGRGQQSAPRTPRDPGTAVDAERVASLLEPVIRAVGMDLEGIRVTAVGRRRLLRLVIDGDGGVSLDDIALVSREVSAALDDSSLMGEQPYTLEVSSPGVDRPLTERRHWRRAIGRLVVVPLTRAASPDEPEGITVEGRIMGASGHGITLGVAGQTREFGYGDLGPGKIKIEFAPIGAAGDDGNDGDDEALDDEDFGDGADEEGSDGY